MAREILPSGWQLCFPVIQFRFFSACCLLSLKCRFGHFQYLEFGLGSAASQVVREGVRGLSAGKAGPLGVQAGLDLAVVGALIGLAGPFVRVQFAAARQRAR